MEFNFSGKRALVTGAAQGIGLAVVKKLIACGASVVALDIKGDQLQQLAKELPGVEPVVVDLNNWDLTLQALKSIGRVQLVVNNAGVQVQDPQRVQNITKDALDWQLRINLNAVIAVSQHVVKDLSSSGQGGAIVNIASIAATEPIALGPVYAASKAGMLQFTRCLAVECGPLGIRVNAVSPGMVRTEMTRYAIEDPERMAYLISKTVMKDPICEPEDVANAVVFLLCDKNASKITGINLPVDAGRSL